MGLDPDVFWYMTPLEWLSAARGYRERYAMMRTAIWADKQTWSRMMKPTRRRRQTNFQQRQEDYFALKQRLDPESQPRA